MLTARAYSKDIATKTDGERITIEEVKRCLELLDIHPMWLCSSLR